MNPADHRRGCHGKGTSKEGAPPARRSALTNPSAMVSDFVLDPRLLKEPQLRFDFSWESRIRQKFQ